MHSTQLAVGLVLVVLGVSTIAFAYYELPHAQAPLAATPLIPSGDQFLPSMTSLPSDLVVPLPYVPSGAFLWGNFTTGAPGSTVAFYLLDAADWAIENASDSGHGVPTSFATALGSRSSGGWGYNTTADGPFALLYLGPSDGSFAISETVAYTPDASSSSVGLSVPSNPSLVREDPVPGRAVVILPPLSSVAIGIRGSFSVPSGAGGGAQLYLLSPNNSTECPAATFLPSDPACENSFLTSGSWVGMGGTPVSWYAQVHGTVTGWTLVFLSAEANASTLSYNATELDPSKGAPLDTGSLVGAVGAGMGFFGFLAATGSFVRRGPTEAAGASVEVSTGPSSPRKSVQGPRPDVDGWRRETVAHLEARPGTAPPSRVPPSPPPQSPPSPVLTGEGRVTCGLCGTGYPLKSGRPSCPVCGSKSVVYATARGLELR
ncbi:MAG: hypothetical protein KGJ23_01305 [Euryarchaeota archaeon]|nr:hypothetical protein [Euryarchaeota archaeon]MDE1835235.1 hypothetical protein [Euryarchaeota archaeon]MDE1881038.1 hypothetical protein [Euryarchaeota archaeon]MDE2043531.1 hypothetical protein [Thermoplasmata archaeon]